MRKICFYTGTRAEYGLLRQLMKEVDDDPELELQLLVSGMHLSPEFGLTYKEIENDGFVITEKVEMLLSSDTSVGITKSIGLGVLAYGEVLNRLKPDLFVGLGDRFELLAAVTAAMISRVPIAHLHGGETTEGAVDEAIRHSITKMSHLHFTATEEYRRRVIQLGESPDRVFNYGAISIDNIRRTDLLSKEAVEAALNISFNRRTLLVTFHPVTLEADTAAAQFCELLSALDTLEDVTLLFTYPNADANGRVIIDLVNKYVKRNDHKAAAFVSMGALLYLSTLQFTDCVVGNSSSGIIEVPSFKKATLNIGQRQFGRIQADSTVNCDPVADDIISALNVIFSPSFQNRLATTINPYEGSQTVQQIKDRLKSFPLTDIIRKKFYDLDSTL